MKDNTATWLALIPPYLVVFAAAYGWLRSKVLRNKIDWKRAATLLSTKLANEEEKEGL